MFTMMNNARLSVGLQGVGLAEAACQRAAHYAAERVQGLSPETGARVTIDAHGDVRRMLDTMRALTSAGRLMTYQAALYLDAQEAGDAEATALAGLLTPVVKSWCTDMAVRVACTGIQIHGGMGYIEETGAAQYLRDARILPIYEGTNGIQALDLVLRKILRDKGKTLGAWIETLEGSEDISKTSNALHEAAQVLMRQDDLHKLSAAASPFLHALGTFAGGAMLEKAAAASETYKPLSAFYNGVILPESHAALSAALYYLDGA
jgi:hypothetical protein